MTSSLSRRSLGPLAALAATGLLASPRVAFAAWPERQITLIVPFPAGGGSDIVSRIVARRLSERLGQPIVIDNRTGAGGIIGFQTGARAAPDGYTLTTLTQNISSNPHLYPDANFDARAAFRLLSMMVKVYSVLLVNPRRVPFRTLPELIAFARANQGKLTAGNGGIAGNGHMAMEMLNSTAGLEIRQIPYRGEGPMLNDLISGQFDVAFHSSAGLRQHIDSGSLHALAVSEAHRMPAFPEVPAVAETLPGFQYNGWWGLGVPAATPDEIAGRLLAELHATLDLPDVRRDLALRGFDATTTTPEEFRALADKDERLYVRLAADRRIATQ
jgi:tripartite-type tricarboxylate transporter receptor subunit TctC